MSPGIKLPTRSVKTPGILLSDRRPVALTHGLGIVASRLTALLEHPLDDAAGDLHAESRHGGAVGQWKDVSCLERLAGAIHERLADRHLRQQPVDPAVHIQRHKRQPAAGGLQCPEAGVVLRQ